MALNVHTNEPGIGPEVGFLTSTLLMFIAKIGPILPPKDWHVPAWVMEVSQVLAWWCIGGSFLLTLLNFLGIKIKFRNIKKQFNAIKNKLMKYYLFAQIFCTKIGWFFICIVLEIIFGCLANWYDWSWKWMILPGIYIIVCVAIMFYYSITNTYNDIKTYINKTKKK